MAEGEASVKALKSDLQAAEVEKQGLLVQIEAKNADIEIIQLEVDALKFDKEELL